MKQLKNLIALPAFVIVIIAILFSACRKPLEPCHKVNATGKGNIVTQTTTGAATESVITGIGLYGTTTANLVFTGSDPVTGNLLFKGDLVLNNDKGTITFNAVNGILNPATGEFSNDAEVTAGTGAYKNETGALYFHGFTYPDGSFADDEISGELCNCGIDAPSK